MQRVTPSDPGQRVLLVPENRRERAKGLLGRARLGPGEGLLLKRVRSIHTFGMRFAIDVAWLDDAGVVLDARRVAPARVTRPRRGARHMLECAASHGPSSGEIVTLPKTR